MPPATRPSCATAGKARPSGRTPSSSSREDRGEERCALDVVPELDAQRRRRLRGVRGQLGRGLVDVDADPEHDAARAGLGEDAGELAACDDDVVRVPE